MSRRGRSEESTLRITVELLCVATLFRPFDCIAHSFKYLAFQSFDFERT
jgi:hypothetical protein